MATRIVNKLYTKFGYLLKTTFSTVNTAFRDTDYVVSTVMNYEPPVKRPTKNLESLIKAANKAGYIVHLCQSTYDRTWYCHLFKKPCELVNKNNTRYMDTPYKALKAALDSIDWK